MKYIEPLDYSPEIMQNIGLQLANCTDEAMVLDSRVFYLGVDAMKSVPAVESNVNQFQEVSVQS